MKKIIMTSFAAIAFLIAFTGCSKNDLYDQGAVDERNRQEQEKKDQQKELTVNEKYAAAFEKAFGKVGPNVDWGFGRQPSSTRALTRAVGTYAQYKGNMQPTISFPSDCNSSNFLTVAQIPTTASAMPDRQVGPGSFVIDENTAQVDVYNGTNCFIYVKGYVDMSNKKFTSEGQKIYLTEGSTLKLSATAAQDLKAKIYIAANALLETTGHLLMDVSSEVYNHGTIKAESFELTASSILYNVGKLETTGKTEGTGRVIVNANDRIVNDGTIDCAEVIIRAAAVQNNAEWTVKGTTTIESNNSGWVNNGHWTTYDYAYIAGSWNVINNCFLEVENDFEMNISSVQGAFKIDGGGGVLTKNFYGGRDSSTGAVSGPFVIEMGPKAVFKVTETAQLESSRDDDNGFGIFGPTEGEYAVFQAKDIVRSPYLQSISSHGAVAYGGHLYVSAETHFAQGYDSDGTGTYTPRSFIIEKPGFSIDNNIYGAGFKSGKPNITIPQTPCNPGFQGGNPLYRVIAEDLSARVQRSTVYSARMSLTRMVSIICITQVSVLRCQRQNLPLRALTRRLSRSGISSSRYGRMTNGWSLKLKQVRLHVRFWSMTRSCLLRRDRISPTRMVISPTTYKAISWMTSGGSNGFIAENIKGSLLQAGLF